jgi:hypothetical protein
MIGFNLEDIFIKKSPVHDRAWVLHVEMNGFQYSGYFDSWDTFLLAFKECVTFFAFKAGKINKQAANQSLTRLVS